MKTKTTIAILASTAGLAAAMQIDLTKKHPDAEFVNITKLNERPAGSIVASLGLPSFVPGQDGLKVLSYGSKIVENATQDERKHQWQVLRDPEASTEDVLAQLGNIEEYQINKGKAIAEAKSAIVDVKLAVAEARDIEDKDEAAKATLAAYKAGFDALAAMLS